MIRYIYCTYKIFVYYLNKLCISMKNKLNKLMYYKGCEEYANINLLNYIDSNNVKVNDKIWNYRDNIVLIERENQLYYWTRNKNKLCKINERFFVVPINGYVIYKTINIFSQNNCEIANCIYSIVLDLLDNLMLDLINEHKIINLYGIGGEFYVYFKILRCKYRTNKLNKYNPNNYKFIYNGYSNNKEILEAAQKNYSCSEKCYNLINYNTYNFNMVHNGITLINLSKINKNILKNLKTKYVVCITCKDFINYGSYNFITIKKVVKINNVKIQIFKIV